MVVAALSSAVSPIARRYCAESTAWKLAAVTPPVRSEPGTNSRTLSRNSAPRAVAKSTIATRPGASSRGPASLARNDVGVEPLLPLRQQRRARLVVDDVAALLPLRGRGEDAGLALERGGHAGLHVRGAGLETGRELLLDVLRQQQVDELVGVPRLLAAGHDRRHVDAEDAGLVRRLHDRDRHPLLAQVEGVDREHHLHRCLARLHEVLAARVGREERRDAGLELSESLLAFLPRLLVAAFEQRADRDDVRGIE